MAIRKHAIAAYVAYVEKMCIVHIFVHYNGVSKLAYAELCEDSDIFALSSHMSLQFLTILAFLCKAKVHQIVSSSCFAIFPHTI